MLVDDPPPTPPQSLEGLDEAELINGLRRGDRDAAAELIRTNYKRIYRLLARMNGDPTAAEDLCQETFRRAWRGIASFRGEAGFATWLHAIALRVHAEHRRRPRAVTVELEEHQASFEPDTEAVIDRRRAAEKLRKAVLGLPDELRSALIARYWGELPATAIAASEGISEQAVNKRLRKARTRLAVVLEETS